MDSHSSVPGLKPWKKYYPSTITLALAGAELGILKQIQMSLGGILGDGKVGHKNRDRSLTQTEIDSLSLY